MIRTFSSRSGRLSKTNKMFLNKISTCKLDLNSKLPEFKKKLVLDIGFGDGESFCKDVLENEDIIFIGIEPYVKGFSRVVEFYEKHNVPNLYVFNGCAKEFLKSTKIKFDFIRIHFPDPWPKNKHYKRQLINKDFVELLHISQTPDGMLQIVTDCTKYQLKILNILSQQFNYSFIDKFPLKFNESSFAKKAKKNGNPIKVFNLQS